MKRIVLVGACLLIVGCAATATQAAKGPSAKAVLHDALGNEKAQATVTQVGPDLRVRVTAAGMVPGSYGVHIHARGRCEAPDYASSGPHWNPTKHQHGKDNPQGMHMGDLPNLVVGNDGRGSLDYTVAGAALREGTTVLLDSDGAAIIIHSGPDDYRTDPSGNSGARMVCGVLG